MHEKINNGQSQNKWMSEVNRLWLWKWSQSMIKIDSEEVLWNEFEKSQGLGVQVFNLKTWRCLHNIYLNFESNVWKGLGHNGDEWMKMESKTS